MIQSENIEDTLVTVKGKSKNNQKTTGKPLRKINIRPKNITESSHLKLP